MNNQHTFLLAERDHLRDINAELVAALAWFADPTNYEDTEQNVAYLRNNKVWLEGIGRAKNAIARATEEPK